MSNVPLATIDDTGISAPASSAIYAGVMADFIAAFNSAAMSTDPETPQGQLGTAWTATIEAFVDVMLAIASRMDPATSSGRWQDAIGRFFNQYRIASRATVVSCVLSGAVGTPIPAGVLARTQGGDIYEAVGGGTIPAGGSLTLEFQCTVAGPTACPAGYLNQVYQGVSGWDTITNPADGTPGLAVEAPQAFEARRQATVQMNGRGFNAAMRGALLDPDTTPNVVDAYVWDNASTEPVTVRGITVPAGALYACVYGGADADVAATILSKKSPGTPYYAVNPTTVNVQDTGSGYQEPYPTYPVTFDRPVFLPLAMVVELSSLDTVPSDVATQVQTAVASVLAGTDGSTKGAPQMGSRVLATRFYNAISALGTWAEVVRIKLGCANDTDAAAFTGSIAGNVLTVSAVASGTLATGQTVGGALPGTIISGQTGGTTGGAGTYTVGVAQTLASGPLTSYAVDGDYADLNANQRPSIAAGDIAVNLV